MFNSKSNILSLLFIFCSTFLFAQNCVKVEPQAPTLSDTVTITFDAALGNKALLNYKGDVFMHSGLITGNSASPNDWKYQVGTWGTNDLPAIMKKSADNIYEKKIILKDYFSVPPTEEIKYMTFVFRDVTGNITGKAELDQDIFVQVQMKPESSNKKFYKNYQAHEYTNGILYIKSDTALLKVQAYSNSILKLSYFPSGIMQADTSYSVILEAQNLETKLTESNDYLDFSTSEIRVRITKFPLRVSYFKSNLPNSPAFLQDENGFFTTNQSKGFRFSLNANEALYGSGSRATDLNKRGQKFSTYNTASYGYKIGAPTLNVNIPLLVSTELYALYFENHSAGYFDIGATEKSVLEYKVEQGNLAYYLISGPSFESLLNQYTSLTGRQPLPPLWSLGFIQSKYGYQSDKEALKIVTKLQKQKFPIDGLVLDLYWFGTPKTMGNMDWDRKKFKEPEQLLKNLDELGVKLIPITETFIAKTSNSYEFLDKNNLLAKSKSGNSFVIENFWAGPSGLLDIYKPEAGDWMWQKYKTQIDKGVAGWWCDLGEPESHPDGMLHSLGNARYVHNVYSLFWAKLLADKYKQEYPNQRLFNLIRSGYAGMQRYNTFPWSGDVQRSYDGLKAQVQIMLSMGMSGVAYMHSDLGGFTGGPKNPELYTRWLQFGAFCPIMRAHGEGVPAEPIYYKSKYKDIVRSYIQLRYRLLPYNYTLSYQNTSQGMPITRPLNFNDPNNQSLANVCDEYFWGPNFLIAPVFEANAQSRSVIFPQGNWINYWNDSIYSGNTRVTVDAPLDKMPVFVKAGSFIPTTSLCNSTKFYKTDSLFVYVYPDKSTSEFSFEMFNDDGKDAKSIENKQFEKLNFVAMPSENYFNISLTKSGDYPGAPQTRTITYILKLQVVAPKAVIISTDTKLKLLSREELNKSKEGYCYLPEKQEIQIRFVASENKMHKVRVEYK
jgi:oligosaccharide 4-alpha-D-glucosyltransferase